MTPSSDVAFLEAHHDGSGSVLDPESPTLAELPGWLAPVVSFARTVRVTDLTRWPPPPEGGRASSVLILFGEASTGADVLLIERAHDMRSHSGQPAFPGGALDPGDSGIVAGALREAVEETGLDARGVRPFAVLPDLFVPPSGFVVSPVLAWWAQESEVGVVDPREVASVHRVPWRTLIDPVNRVRVRHPSGYIGSGFRVGELVVWGFTGGLLDRVIALAGWEQPWDRSVIVDVDERIEPFDEGPAA
jgi:8-oxo-dGTP pyrophosphatase MutT (NUDIX family)